MRKMCSSGLPKCYQSDTNFTIEPSRARVDTISAHSHHALGFGIVHSGLTLREAILENLKSRAWRAGHRLPTERELSGQFGLSRSTVRRVLADLKGRGLITQTVGSGTYVSDEVGRALAE